MEHKTTEALLRGRLLREADESLLQFTAVNAHSILYWSLDRYCKKAAVSEEACTTFFSAFGTDSFTDFKNILRSVLYQDTQGAMVSKRSIASITEELIETEIRNLKDLSQAMDYENLQRLTLDIQQASDVLVIGNGGAAPYAGYLCDMLSKLGVKAHRMTSLAGFFNSYDCSTLVISFGIARYSRRSVLQLRALRQRGFRIVAFTDRHDSPWVDLSDYCFFMPLRGFDFVDSYTAGFTLVNTLLLNMGLQDEQKLISNLNTHDATLEDMDVFF